MLRPRKLRAISSRRNCRQVILRGALCLVNVVEDELLSATQFRGGSRGGSSSILSRSTPSDRPAFLSRNMRQPSWDLLGEKSPSPQRLTSGQADEKAQKYARQILSYSIGLITRSVPGNVLYVLLRAAIVCRIRFE